MLSRWKMMAGVLGVSLGGLAAAASQCPKWDRSKGRSEETPVAKADMKTDMKLPPAGAPATPSVPPPLPIPTPEVPAIPAAPQLTPAGSTPPAPPLPTTPASIPPAPPAPIVEGGNSGQPIPIVPTTSAPVELPKTPSPVKNPVDLLPESVPPSLLESSKQPPPQTAFPPSPVVPTIPTGTSEVKPASTPPLPPAPTGNLIPVASPLTPQQTGAVPPAPKAADPLFGHDDLPVRQVPAAEKPSTPLPAETPYTKPGTGPATMPPAAATITQPSPFRIVLRVGEGEPTFEVKHGDNLMLKVACEKVDIKSPEKGNGPSEITARGKVRFVGFGAEGTCDELKFFAGTGEVSMSGDVKVQVKDKLGRVESELTTGSMKYKMDTNAVGGQIKP